MKLADPVGKVKGVGPRTEKKLARLGIYTVEDLISFYPRRYQDWSNITPMDAIRLNEEVCVYGKVLDVKETRTRTRMSIITAVIIDGKGAVRLVYFNQPWKKQELRIGCYILAYGRGEYNFGHMQISNAETEAVKPEQIKSFIRLVPVYPLTEGIRSQQLRSLIQYALSHVEGLNENLPLETMRREQLIGRREAVLSMHSPKNWNDQRAARKRLAFEELFFMQAGILLLRKKQGEGPYGIHLAPSGKLVRAVLDRFPFALTEGQKQAFSDIENDMEGMRPMQRLVQGDVGSGKTAVAALALAKIAENGYQGALMAPTEVLAAQHYKTLSQLFDGLPLRVAYLSGEVKGAERKEILEALKRGAIDILIGTHALIQDTVVFAHLGLVITDEQHRFGVKQRKTLAAKGAYPHSLVMTATPIPRTMALSVYGDLDVSSIRGLPPGRHPVKTYVVDHSYLQRILAFMRKEMEAGHQVYVVCPLVEESEKQDLAAAVSVYQRLKEKEFPDLGVGLVHGRMKNTKKEQIMCEFSQGTVKLLVATSVIEVGVNVPAATIMFVYGADRFGLSQLHQLRGRVGRGKDQAYCILYTDNDDETVKMRMELMRTIQDGFLLSEKDLLLRGSGEFFGYHQHGMPDLRVANIVKDLPLLEKARADAREAIGEGMDFRHELAQRFKGGFFERIYGDGSEKA